MEESIMPLSLGGKLVSKFTGLDRKKKIITGLLILPFVILAVIMILEKLFTVFSWLYNIFWDILGHYADKENRRIYTFSIFVFVAIGIFLEYNFGIADALEGYWIDLVEFIGGIL